MGRIVKPEYSGDQTFTPSTIDTISQIVDLPFNIVVSVSLAGLVSWVAPVTINAISSYNIYKASLSKRVALSQIATGVSGTSYQDFPSETDTVRYGVSAVFADGSESPIFTKVATVNYTLRYLYTFTVSGNNQLRLIDILDPTNPVLVGQCGVNLSNQLVGQMIMDKNNLYVGLADKIYILRWIDTPASPTLLGTISWTLNGSFLKEGNFIYTSDWDGGGNLGIASYDITDPANPVLISSVRVNLGVQNYTIPYRSICMDSARNLYIVFWNNTTTANLVKMSVSTLGVLSSPSTVQLSTAGNFGGPVFLQTDNILWVSYPAGGDFLGFTPPNHAPFSYTGGLFAASNLPKVFFRGSISYEASPPFSNQVPVIISNQANPASVQYIALIGTNGQSAVAGLVVSGNILVYYNTTTGKLYCYNITNPASPVLFNAGGTTMNLGGPTFICGYTPDAWDGRNGLIV